MSGLIERLLEEASDLDEEAVAEIRRLRAENKILKINLRGVLAMLRVTIEEIEEMGGKV